jgi:hypothetical protein
MNQGEVLEDGDPIKDMSVNEMEKVLYRMKRRPAERIRGEGAPQTARALLEENKQLVLEKQQRKALARKNSREFVEKLLADDRMVNEADKAKDIGRRTAQQGLAQYYKAKIAEKEAEKASSYSTKRESGVAIQFFPFVEGETIVHNRKVEAARMRDEMRGFLKQQREAQPPRLDSLMADQDPEYHHHYPLMPVQSQTARSSSSRRPPQKMDPDLAAPGSTGFVPGTLDSDEVEGDTQDLPRSARTTSHLSRYPKFLTRAREHMSRRIHDAHVRKTLEDHVERTKAELEELTQRRQTEARTEEEGMMVNDALRYDSSRVNNAERKKNAEYLLLQVEERRDKKKSEVQARRAEPVGYYGPDEKTLPDANLQRLHCSDLIKQMEVNQHRRLDSRMRRLDQERVVVDNSVTEMSNDRQKEKEKLWQHKEILTTTWDSQRKIREVMSRIDAL